MDMIACIENSRGTAKVSVTGYKINIQNPIVSLLAMETWKSELKALLICDYKNGIPKVGSKADLVQSLFGRDSRGP